MGLENCTDTLFTIGGDTQWSVSKYTILETDCVEADDSPLQNISASAECAFSGTIDRVDEDAICKLCGVESANDFFLYNEISVMVMKRWHKNWRIRKKWLKRYGTIPSTVKMLYQVDEVMPEQRKDDTVSISANVKCIGFSFEPWQLRRGMIVKIGDSNED